MTDRNATMVTLTDVVQDRSDGTESSDDLVITDNREQGIYEARIGDESVAGAVYTRRGAHVTLLATSVYPQHRGKGIAGRMIAGVLDDLKGRNETVTVSCPFATTYLQSHTEYRNRALDVVDAVENLDMEEMRADTAEQKKAERQA